MSSSSVQNDRSSQLTVVVILLTTAALLVPLARFPGPANASAIPWRPELALSMISLLAVLFLYSKAKDFSIPTPLNWVLALMFVFAAYSGFARPSFAATHHTLVWANYAAALFVTFAFVRRLGKFNLLVAILSSLAIVLLFLMVLDFAMVADFFYQEGALRIRYGKFAEMLATLAPVLLGAAVYARSWRRFWIGVLPALAAYIGIMLSLSKGAFLASIISTSIALLLMFVFSRSAFRRRILAAAGIWIVSIAAFQLGTAYLTSLPATTEYVVGTAEQGGDSSSMRVFTWKLGLEMFRTAPVFGVGADNFGPMVNEARKIYAEKFPASAENAIGEDYVFERAHNEPLQILAELGIVGFAIFALWAAVIVGFFGHQLLRSRGNCSPLFVASLAGCLAFGISSMFSSFSFRAFQNGLVFFIVLGIGFAFTPKFRRGHSSSLTAQRKPFLALMLVCVIGLAAYSAVKGAAYYIAYFGASADSVETAYSRNQLAGKLDPTFVGTDLAMASMDKTRGSYQSAAEHARKAIDGGLGVSTTYTFLADIYEQDNDLKSVEAAIREGVSVFPHSMFLRAKLVNLLRKQGLNTDAEAELEKARSIDLRNANGWDAVIRHGVSYVNSIAQTDASFAKPSELKPAAAIDDYARRTEKMPGMSR